MNLGRFTIGSLRNHYLFGYPTTVQEISIMKGWTQLLQLGGDNIMRWEWVPGHGLGASVHFMIKEEDLKKNYYEDIKIILDSS